MERDAAYLGDWRTATGVDVLVDRLEDGPALAVDLEGQVTTPADGGDVQNTPADGPYPFVQPGVDYDDGESACETRMIPRGYGAPDGSVNRRR